MRNSPSTAYSKTVYDTLLQAYRPFLFRIIFLILIGFLGRYLIISNAQVIGDFLDKTPEINRTNLTSLFYQLLGLIIASFILTVLFRTLLSRLSALAVSRIYDETTYRVSRFPISFFESQPVGKITTRFSSDYGNVFRLFGGPLAEFLSILFDLVSIIILMVLVHPYFLVTALSSAVIYYFILSKNQTKLRQTRRQLSVLRAPSISHFSETVQGATIIRQNEKKNTFIQKFSEYDSQYLTAKWSVFWRVTRFSFELNVVSSLLFAVNAFLCMYLIHQGVIGIGLTSVVLSFTLLSTNTLQMFFEWFSQFEEALTGVEKMDEYIRSPIESGIKLPAYSDFSTSHPKKEKTLTQKTEEVLPHLNQEQIQVENLCFKYPTSDHLILDQVSFKLKQGEKLGIIGRTGSGKTTLIAVLLKLYPFEKGAILVNGINEADTEKHRSLFSVISQDQLFLTGTIRDNLDLFKKKSNQELEDVLKRVGLRRALTDPVIERGQNLSYGEKQLLSLARGLLQNAQIFIFDEATSNVDPQSESLMNKALTDVLFDKTQIRIAHRLQTVEDCNQILWLDSGKVKKLGPAKEVLEAFTESR
ncbi:ABC transporter ATP-binding protein [Pseudobdellovibrio exovorus]|uniref:Multidrug ABC transporter permease/ATPase n=1 Tax=Pseudobdellovibrio exovorus JSS TaxID=1184267 RepID=M4VPV1_9BACT|nr:ABC transporter ATP-binding protein [Pseudobdellovibrio exovorus]AGH95164.1 multidrug ABC transporter permease/ATPase [Pseudobdellovibrio exovorus JSS]